MIVGEPRRSRPLQRTLLLGVIARLVSDTATRRLLRLRLRHRRGPLPRHPPLLRSQLRTMLLRTNLVLSDRADLQPDLVRVHPRPPVRPREPAEVDPRRVPPRRHIPHRQTILHRRPPRPQREVDQVQTPLLRVLIRPRRRADAQILRVDTDRPGDLQHRMVALVDQLQLLRVPLQRLSLEPCDIPPRPPAPRRLPLVEHLLDLSLSQRLRVRLRREVAERQRVIRVQRRRPVQLQARPDRPGRVHQQRRVRRIEPDDLAVLDRLPVDVHLPVDRIHDVRRDLRLRRRPHRPRHMHRTRRDMPRRHREPMPPIRRDPPPRDPLEHQVLVGLRPHDRVRDVRIDLVEQRPRRHRQVRRVIPQRQPRERPTDQVPRAEHRRHLQRLAAADPRRERAASRHRLQHLRRDIQRERPAAAGLLHHSIRRRRVIRAEQEPPEPAGHDTAC